MDDLSCVFTLRQGSVIANADGGHRLLYGFYCGDKSAPMRVADAEAFVAAIRLYDRDPVQIRARQVASQPESVPSFAAIRVTGNWPLDDSPVVGLKLAVGDELDGALKLTIRGEICEASLTRIDSNGLGRWVLKCRDNEGAAGRYSRDRGGSFSFRGKTATSKRAIEWEGYPVL